MDGNEEIGLVLTRDVHALAQGDVVVSGAHQHALHARLGVHLLFRRARDGEDHVLFAASPWHRWRPGSSPPWPASMAITMSRGLPAAVASSVISGRAPADCPPVPLLSQVHHQAVPVLIVGRQQEALVVDRLLQVEDHPQIRALRGLRYGCR